MSYSDDGSVQVHGNETGDNINSESIEYLSHNVEAMMAHIFDPSIGIPDFNVADSNLRPIETEEFVERTKQKLRTTGPAPFEDQPRVRQREIDPTTNMPRGMTDAEIERQYVINQRDEEYKEIEEKNKIKMAEMEMKRQKEREEAKERLEKQAKIDQIIEDKKEIAKAVKENLPEEPTEDHPEVTVVSLRLPSGESITRRFLKTDKIQLLYDFVTSLGNETGFESSHSSFSIRQPMPPKEFEEMDKTLAEEGLHPRCRVIVREHSHAE